MDEESPQPPPAPWAVPPLEPVVPRARRSGRRRVVAAIAVALLAVGGVAAVLVTTGRLGRPATPPPRVVLVDPAGGLAIVDGAGGGRIVHAPSGTAFTFPAWSPDGTRVAAVANTGDSVAIQVYGTGMDAPADGTTVYTSSDSAPFYLYWTPDGRAITFLTARGRQHRPAVGAGGRQRGGDGPAQGRADVLGLGGSGPDAGPHRRGPERVPGRRAARRDDDQPDRGVVGRLPGTGRVERRPVRGLRGHEA